MTIHDESLGPCCGCAATEGVRNILMLDKRAPIPGTGWGCVVCCIPNDGAVAVLCDTCLEAQPGSLHSVCKGFAGKGERVPFETVIEPFGHNMELHSEDVL